MTARISRSNKKREEFTTNVQTIFECFGRRERLSNKTCWLYNACLFVDCGDGGDGGGDVPEAARRGAGRGQRGAVAAGGGEDGSGAGDVPGEAGVDHAAHGVRRGGVRADEGRGRAASRRSRNSR